MTSGDMSRTSHVSENEKRQLDTRIGGVAAILLGMVLVQAANVPFGAGPPITYSTTGQIVSIGVFVFVSIPLAYVGSKWMVNPGDRGGANAR